MMNYMTYWKLHIGLINEVENILKKISDHLLPLFKGKSAKQILDTINHSHIKPYTDEEKDIHQSKHW